MKTNIPGFIWTYGCDVVDGAGAGDERGGEMILTLAVVDLAHVGHNRSEDADDGAAGTGLGRWGCMEGGRGRS